METDSPQSYMVCVFKCVQMCVCERGTAGWRRPAEMDVGQDLHEEAISNRDAWLPQVKQMAALARAAPLLSAQVCSKRVCARVGGRAPRRSVSSRSVQNRR